MATPRGARWATSAAYAGIHQVLPIAYAHEQRRIDPAGVHASRHQTASAAAIRLSNRPPAGTVEFQPVSAPATVTIANAPGGPTIGTYRRPRRRTTRNRSSAMAGVEPQRCEQSQPASRGRPMRDRALHHRDRDIVARRGHPDHVHAAETRAPQPDPAAVDFWPRLEVLECRRDVDALLARRDCWRDAPSEAPVFR